MARPFIRSIAVTDSLGNKALGKLNETVTITLTLSEALSAKVGAKIDNSLINGSSVIPTFVVGNTTGTTFNATGTLSNINFIGYNASAKTLTYTATLPNANASQLVLSNLSVSSAFTLTNSKNEAFYNWTETGRPTIKPAGYTLDSIAPSFASLSTNASFNENVRGATVYTAVATGANSYSLSGADASLFSIDRRGVVKMKASADFEVKSSYSFSVVASDNAGNSALQAVNVSVNNVNEPVTLASTAKGRGSLTFVKGAATAFNLSGDFVDPERAALSYTLIGKLPTGLILSAAGVITGTPTDATATTGNITVSVRDIPTSKAVTRVYSYNYQTQPLLSKVDVFDASGNTNVGKAGDVVTLQLKFNEAVASSVDGVSLNNNNITPSFVVRNGRTLSTLSVSFLNHNQDTINFTATLPAANNLSAASGVTLSALSLNGVTLKGLSSQNLYAFDSKKLLLDSYIIDNTAPVLVSGTTAKFNENISAGSVVYTAKANRDASPLTYSIQGADAALLSINPSTGAVSVNAHPDFEAKNAYTFSVIATDGAGLSSAARQVVLSVNDLPEAPSVNRLQGSLPVGGQTAYDLVAVNNQVVNLFKPAQGTTPIAPFINVFDPDVASTNLTLTLTPYSGKIAGLTATVGGKKLANQALLTVNATTGVWTISGSDDEVNAALRTLTFTPNNFSGFNLQNGLERGYAYLAYRITDNDRGRVAVNDKINFSVRYRPEVLDFSITDSVTPFNAGRANDTVTVSITLSEAVQNASTQVINSGNFSAFFKTSTSASTSFALVPIGNVTINNNVLTFQANLPSDTSLSSSAIAFSSMSLTGLTLNGSLSGKALQNYTGAAFVSDQSNYQLINQLVGSHPSVSQVRFDNDSGNDANDRVSNATPNVVTLNLASAYTLPAGNHIEVSADGSNWVRAVAVDATIFTVTGLTFTSNAANSRISVRRVDQVGNTGAVTDVSYTLDTTAPTVLPTISNVSFSQDSGISANDRVTNQSSQTITLTAQDNFATAAGERLQISVDGQNWLDVTSVSPTTFTAAGVTLSSSANAVLARVIDTAGNVSTVSNISNNSYQLDTTAPSNLPSVTSISLSNDSGIANDRITNQASQTITLNLASGYTPDAGDRLQISLDGVNWLDASNVTDNSYTVSGITLPAGNGTVMARVVDVAGNSSAVTSSNNNFTLDTTAPSNLPTINDFSLSTDTGIDGTNTDKITSFANQTITLTLAAGFTASSGETLQISADGTNWVNAVSVSANTFTAAGVVFSNDGTYPLMARMLDTAGNSAAVTVSNSSYTFDTILETVLPSSTSVISLSAGNDTGESSSDKITTQSSVSVVLTPPSALTLATGESLQISSDGTTWVTMTSANNGVSYISDTVQLSAGTNQFSLRIVDVAGNSVAVQLNNTSYTFDNVAPTNLPTVTSVSLSNDTGISGDRVTNELTQTVTLNLSSAFAPDNLSGKTVQISANGTDWVTATAASNQLSYSAAGITLASGSSNSFSVRVLGSAGNSTVLSGANISNNDYRYISGINSMLPTVTDVTFSHDSGAADRITNIASQTVTLVLNGTFQPAAGEKLQISANGTDWVDATAVAGNQSYSASGINLSSGSGTIRARVSDGAANSAVLALSNNSYTLDTQNPTFSQGNLDSTENTKAIFTFTATDDFSSAGALRWSITGGADRNLFSLNASTGVLSWLNDAGRDYDVERSAAGNRSYAITVTVTDQAGNTSNQNLTVNVLDVNETPVISAVPAGTLDVVMAVASDLPNFTVADPEDDNLTVTLLPQNGAISIDGYNDADSNLAGYQITGKASVINPLIASAKFTSDAGASAASLSIQVQDSANTASSQMTFNVINTVLLDLDDRYINGSAGDTAVARLTYDFANGGTVYLLNGTTTLASHTFSANANSHSFNIQLSDFGGTTPADGDFTLSALYDPASGVDVISNNRVLVIDTINPTVTSLTANASISNGATQAEATAAGGVYSLQVSEAGNAVVTFSRSGGGTVTKSFSNISANTSQTVTLTQSDLITLGDGTISVSAVVTDKAGNTSATQSSSFELDTVNPSAAALTIASGHDQYLNANETQLVFTATLVAAENGGAVQLKLNGSNIGSAVNLAGGASTAQITINKSDINAGANGLYTFNTVVTDSAGNTSANSANQIITIDGTAPALVSSVTVQGYDSSNNAKAGSALKQGDKVVFSIDLGEAVSGLSNLPSGSVSNLLTIGGTAVSASWNVPAGGMVLQLVYTIAANNNGAIALDVSALKTAINNANIQDLAGNVVNLPDAFSFSAPATTLTADTINPSGYTVNSSSFSSTIASLVQQARGSASSIAINPNGSNEQLTLALSKALDSGETLQWSIADTGVWADAQVSSTTATISTNFTGTQPVQLRVIDQAGNSQALPQITITSDIAAPSASGISVSGGDADLSATQSQVIFTVSVSGVTNFDGKVQLKNGNSLVGSAVAVPSGASSVNVTLAKSDINSAQDGTYSISAVVTDSAGNTSADSPNAVINLDSVAPLALTSLSAKAVNADNSDKAVNAIKVGDKIVISIDLGEALSNLRNLPTGAINNVIQLGGTAVAGSWNIPASGNAIQIVHTVVAGENGTFSVNVANLKTALNTLQVSDVAGNVMSLANEFSFSAPSTVITADTISPVAIAVTSSSLTSMISSATKTAFGSGSSLAIDPSANSETLYLNLSASLPATEKLQWSSNGTSWNDVTVVGTLGSITQDFNGSETLRFRQIDTAGNATTLASNLALTSDTTAPSLVTGIRGASIDGNILTLTFNEPINNMAGFMPTVGDFGFTGGGTIAATALHISGNQVHFTLNHTYTNTDSMPTLNYTNGADATDIQDFAGNELASFNGQVIQNHTLEKTLLSAANLNNVTNLSVNSNIVLDVSNTQASSLTLGTGKIRISNTGGSGLNGELIDNDIEIDVATGRTVLYSTPASGTLSTITLTSLSSVSFDSVNKKLIINPAVDLDFANSYTVTADAGVITGSFVFGSGSDTLTKTAGSVALTAGISFSTVTPDTSATTGGQSQEMTNLGALQAGYQWLSLEGRGSGGLGALSAVIDASGGRFAFVISDYNPNPSTAAAGGDTQVAVNNFNVLLNNLNLDDLFYMDNRGVVGNTFNWLHAAEIINLSPNAKFSPWLPYLPLGEDNSQQFGGDLFFNLQSGISNWISSQSAGNPVTVSNISIQDLINKGMVVGG